jgi:ferredoxin
MLRDDAAREGDFDPHGVLNPGKIIDTPPMDTFLRHDPGHAEPAYKTVFDFSSTHGVLAATEKCTGVGECRKTALMGGTMCPSYMATRNEQDTTRARANMLRHVLSHPRDFKDPWDSAEVKGVMDLCLSCKGCKAECPSNVDLARLKAEWQTALPRRARRSISCAAHRQLHRRHESRRAHAATFELVSHQSGHLRRLQAFGRLCSRPQPATLH